MHMMTMKLLLKLSLIIINKIYSSSRRIYLKRGIIRKLILKEREIKMLINLLIKMKIKLIMEVLMILKIEL